MSKRKKKYLFLEYVKSEKSLREKGYSDLKLISPESGEIWVSKKKDVVPEDINLEVIINIDSRKNIKNYLKIDNTLTLTLRSFLKERDDFAWKEGREAWVKAMDGEIVGSGNTYNEDSYYFWGSVYEYTAFENIAGYGSGIIVMWQLGGDVRGNYSSPEVWLGDVDEWRLMESIGDPESEIASIMGYEGNYTDFYADVHRWFYKV